MSELPKPNFLSILDYHKRQYAIEYASTAKLIELIEECFGHLSELSVLDIGCGGGANIYRLRTRFSSWKFTGIDIDPDAIALAREKNPDATFEVIGMKEAIGLLQGRSFDLILALQLATTPVRATECIKVFLPLARRAMISLDLYNEGPFENDLMRKDLCTGEVHCYQIDSLKTIRKIAEETGFHCVNQSFEIDIDLPKPPYGVSATYTERTIDGRRIQISDPGIILPWQFVLLSRIALAE